MDPEKTAPFELGRGDDACLLIHGFTGSPWDVRPLGEALAARGYRVRGICLPGHGGAPEAMEQVTYRDWQAAAEEALDVFRPFRRVFIAGLSMGALLALILAAKHPRRIAGLGLIAPALRFQGMEMRLLHLLRALPVLDLLYPYVEKRGTDIEDPIARASAPVLAGFPSARLYDIWSLQERARESLAAVQAPALVVTARNDHVVSSRGARELVRGLTGSRLVHSVELREGFHIIPRDKAGARLAEEVSAFFEQAKALAEGEGA